MKVRSFFIFLIVFGVNMIQAQDLPPSEHFSPELYSGGSQNWEIAQSTDKQIYIANNNGLLVYNGANWDLYETPNQTIMRAVSVIGNKVYTGSYMEFGYWAPDPSGQLSYNSLSDKVKNQLIEDEEFWEIRNVGSRIAFQSLKQIYLYDTIDQSFETIPSDGTLFRMFVLNEKIYFQQENAGLFKFSDGSILPVISDPIIQSDEIIQLINQAEGLLIITGNSGIYRQTEQELFRLQMNEIDFGQISIYSAVELDNGDIILGTISDGIIHLSKDLELVHRIDQNSGLGNNTVLSLFEDADQNIWAGLDNGITCINSSSAIRVYSDESGRLGTVYASAIQRDELFIGTNQGLFVRKLSDNEPFEFVEGTEGQVWDLTVIDGTLFCSHHQGTFTIKNKRARLLEGIKGTWKVLQITPTLLLQGAYDGLYVLEKKSGRWSVRNRIEGFNNSARHLEIHHGKVFVNHEYKGVFILTIDNNFRKVLNSKSQTDLIGSNSAITKYKNQILYVSPGGFHKYNADLQKFEKAALYNKVLSPEDYVSGRLPLTSSREAFWLFKKNGIVLIEEVRKDSLYARSIPLSLGKRNDMEEYENMLQIDSSLFLLGRKDGYMLVDLQKFEIPSFRVDMTSKRFAETNKDFVAIKEKVKFTSKENNFQFEFHAPVYYSLFQPSYQTRLVGFYEEWSSSSNNPTISYKNLPPGKYEFQARARIGTHDAVNILRFSFEIAQPWYLTTWMKFLYITAFIVLTLLMHRLYRSYYKKQQAQLIHQNLQELEFQRMKNEQEIITLKNAQLESSFEAKSKELATSLMNIVNKNELLTQIKDQLLRLKDQEGLSAVIRTIDQNLNQKKNWEMFKEAFDNADSEFFKNLKEKHPKLSPNDLKLCAYLRLNLSSKEIAPLINISPRSVEIKRYRLRKKLNLDSNENLVNYILEI